MSSLTCVLLINEKLFYKIRPYLHQEIQVIIKEKVSDLIHVVRYQNVHCGVLYCTDSESFDQKHIAQFKQKYPGTPLLSILSDNCIKTAHAHGCAGIEKVIHVSDIHNLSSEILSMVNLHSFKIKLGDIGIRKLDYSNKVLNALEVIEENYRSVAEVREIAEILQINACTLTRSFKSHELPSPKKILVSLKVKHARRLINDQGLKLAEIATILNFNSYQNLKRYL